MPYFAAQFSAVAAIVQPQCVSSSADHSVSSSCPWPSRRPLRRPRITCGAWLMLSMPPVSTMSGFAELDQLRAADRRLDARAAQPIDRQRRHLDRHARLERRRAARRRPRRRWSAARCRRRRDRPLRLDAGPLHRRARRDRAELERRDVLQLAGVVGHRRARAAENEDRRFSSFIGSRVPARWTQAKIQGRTVFVLVRLVRVRSSLISTLRDVIAGLARAERAADVRRAPARRATAFSTAASIARGFVASARASRASAPPTESRRSGSRRSSRRTSAPSRAPARTSTSGPDAGCRTPPCPARPAAPRRGR